MASLGEIWSTGEVPAGHRRLRTKVSREKWWMQLQQVRTANTEPQRYFIAIFLTMAITSLRSLSFKLAENRRT
jgi:hypothetical protein